MLNEVCEICGAPLMKYKSEKEFCVGCMNQKTKTQGNKSEDLELPEEDYKKF